ncbi:MAG: Spy/CpxP family protein refolding chaperone [Gemmatimonadota bacterium]
MMRRLLVTIPLLLVLGAPTGAVGQQRPEPGGFERYLYPPELIMRYQRRLELTEEQRSAIMEAIQNLQTVVLKMQWSLEDQNQRLSDVLSQPTVDRDAALKQIDRILDTERRVKRVHLAALIRIKNVLTADQQAILRSLRDGQKHSDRKD